MKITNVLIFGLVLSLSACQTVSYLELFSPEESGLNLVKLTDESAGSVGGSEIKNAANYNYSKNIMGWCSTKGVCWDPYTYLALSPDGSKIAYASEMNNRWNVLVRSTGNQSVATQRTFRNIGSGIYWGKDNKIYFTDNMHPNYYICSIDAEQGSVMKQHTNGTAADQYPGLSTDGKNIFFTRSVSTYGPSIWTLSLVNGSLSSCAQGYQACPEKNNTNAFYCVRNSSRGLSEIWYVDYVKGQESLVLSDINHGFTNPVLSPDGQWLLLVGNSESTITQKQNLDIFVVRTDGTQLTQLTFHPENDCSPVWSKDGKSIFFISSRGNESGAFNIWKMNFPF